MALIACSQCGTENEPGARFCKECGTRLGAAGCAVCGTVNPSDAKFCMSCGNNLRAGVAASPAARAATPSAERRLVTVLFVDLVGFTTASERRDAEDTRELLTRYYDAAREIVARYGGTIEKFIGDAVMAVWGTPTAHEDDAERAVRAALELVAAVPRIEGAAGLLQARAGVLTGEAAVSIGLEGQGMIAGDMVNTASRLQSAARPGTVLVGEATYRAANQAIAFEPAGERELKGKEQPVAVWEAVTVVARRGGEGRAATLEPPFVGRDDELELIKELFHSTIRESKPRLVTISGIAGIGKSRLLWELEKYLDGVTQSVFLLSGRSPAYGEGISYWALAEMLRSVARIAESDEPDGARRRIRDMVERFVADESDRRWIEPRVLGLLGLDDLPGESRDELFAAWRTLIERIALDSPVVLSFADLQWADQGMLDFVEHVLGWARSSPILVLAEARPELFDRRPSWGRNVRSATVVHLEPLNAEEMQRLLHGLVPDLPAGAMRQIIDRAEGVPLYAVETLRMLLDRAILEPSDGHYRLTGTIPELSVPETLHALILSRLDGLAPDARSLLTDAAVLGVSFMPPALLAVSGLREEAAVELLGHLVDRELLAFDADARSPERGQYRFVQGVVREVAYQSLARKTRQAKHLAAARYYESVGEEELAGVLATHYLSAYQAAPPGPEADALAAQARVALRAAIDRATSLHDLLGGVAYVEQALPITREALDKAALHERAVYLATEATQFERAIAHAHAAADIYIAEGDRLGLLRARSREASALLAEHRDEPAIQLLRRSLDDVADLQASPEITRAQSELSRALMLAGDPDALAWADRVLENAHASEPETIIDTLITKGSALEHAGRDLEGQVILRGAVEMADALGYLFASIRGRNNLRSNLMWTSLPQALQLTRETYDLAAKFGQRTFIAHAMGALMDVSFRLGDWDAFVEPLPDFAAESPFYVGWWRMEAANREALRGDPVAAEAAIAVNVADPGAVNSAQALTWNLAAKADAQFAQQRFADAFETAVEAWGHSGEADRAYIAGLFAAAALADRDKVEMARAAWRSMHGMSDVPLIRSLELIADTMIAALEGRREDAWSSYRAASRTLDGVGEAVTLARFRLAFGRLMDDGSAELAGDIAQAEAFFGERGASRFAAASRAGVTIEPSSGRENRSGSRSAAVRASG